ncbi:hypothetical protein SARC_13937 [Sphaeroforma arctica JP610]|uniref:Abasic site processing protein HMCES n=1 Tax=Sphaeroforma arctica JP610 TaxID=667725 RepID=A0A0L0F9W5_9EUKA|nr:hypothetical protein SARC_13937 [Sphaeroforma arctica JP610]KNC73505.1 hypothetical protein SARC_13937 [Sphaeroforma arctica JP610]|eukprot:XP_014147407.1 hypothetical protein SARC_13937 [Sphaeroforma arctica JP610]
MAGLYTIWTDPKTKEQVESYTVLTTTPNDSMKWLHDRTPVLLDNEEDIERWLDPDLPYNEVRELAKPYPSKLEWRAISKEIGNIKSEGPHLVEEVKPEKKKKVNSIANYFTKSPAKKRQLKDEPEVVAIKKPKKE